MKNINKKLLWIFIIISVFVIFKSIKYITRQKQHMFWNTNQPVIISNNNKTGIIKELDDLKIVTLPSNLKQVNIQKDVFIDFINKHFEEQSYITLPYIKWQFNSSEYLINGLSNNELSNNELCGVISGSIIYLNIHNKKYKTIYVDYLCIKKKYSKTLMFFKKK